jgi:hypothetical protein
MSDNEFAAMLQVLEDDITYVEATVRDKLITTRSNGGAGRDNGNGGEAQPGDNGRVARGNGGAVSRGNGRAGSRG